MNRKRIPFELPDELRAYYASVIPKTNPGMGFNPFMRAVLFFLSDIDQHLLENIVRHGAKLEMAFKEGSYKLYTGMKVYEEGYSSTEKALFNYMSMYINQPYNPEEDTDYGAGGEWYWEQRERYKNKLKREIMEELRKELKDMK